MNTGNPWDKLSDYFKAPVGWEEIPSGAADNILIGWPVFLKFLEKHIPPGKRILDFGCGTGGFTSKLSSLGYTTVGIDPSLEMIRMGQTIFAQNIDLRVGDTKTLPELGKFDAIVSIMTLQFVQDLQEVFAQFQRSLNLGGFSIFAVFNPPYVTDCIREGAGFSGFDSIDHPTIGMLEFGENIKIPTFIRTAKEYNELLQRYGFSNLLENYPKFTEEFLDKHPNSGPTANSEFMILGYQDQRSGP